MGFLDMVLGFLKKASGESDDPMAYWVYARCGKCGEALKARVDLRNELTAEFGESRADTMYHSRKVIIGSGRCYAPVEVELTFDARRNVVKRAISGGAFLTREEYLKKTGDSHKTGEAV